MTDEHDPTTEDRLIRALGARDAEVSPARGSLSEISARGVRRAPWRRAPLLIAAALVLIGGIAAGVALLGGDDDEPEVATESPTTTITTPPTEAPPTTEPILAETTTTTATTTIPPVPEILAEEGLIVWPRDSRSFSSMERASSSYAEEVLGIVDPDITYSCCDDRTAHARISARGEGGRPLDRDAATLTLVAADSETWEIVRVESPTMTIDRVYRASVGAHSQLWVSGSGTGFEGTGLISATSWCDPDDVRTTVVGVGAGSEPRPFATPVDVPACDVVIIQLSDDPAADGATPSVASIAAPGPGAVDTVVMRVAADDVLNVRSGPDADSEVIDTLSPSATGITATGSVADGWWQIITPSGVEGWADSAFLSVQVELDDDIEGELRTAAAGLAEWLDEDLPVSPPTTMPPPRVPEFSPLGVDIGGIGVFADAPTPFMRVDAADIAPDAAATYDWNPFPGEEPGCAAVDCDLTVSDFLGFEDGDRWDADYVVGSVSFDEPSDRFFVGLPDRYVERFAAVLIDVPATSDGDLDWRTYTVVFDFRGELPEIIAIWRWGWTP